MNRKPNILVVDDEPNVRLVFRTALESDGYTIDEAADGEEALVRCGIGGGPSLVLLDLQMPLMNGMETLRRLREAGGDVPVVIITAHGSIPDAVSAMKLGAIDFLTKPLTPDVLRRVVAEVLARHGPPATAREPVEVNRPVTKEGQFAEDLIRAKRALNNRWFDEAEVHLKQAIGLRPDSAEAHNLKGVLHELRNQHDDSYREYKAALKADRHYEPAQHNMRRYYERFTFGSSDVPLDTGA